MGRLYSNIIRPVEQNLYEKKPIGQRAIDMPSVVLGNQEQVDKMRKERLGSDAVAGVKSGVQDILGLFSLAKSAYGQATGNKEMAKQGYEKYLERQAKSEKITGIGRTASLEDISGSDSLIDYVQFNLGKLVPSMVESLGAAFIGSSLGSAAPGAGTAVGGVGGFFAKNATKKYLAKRVANYIGKEIAENIGEKVVVKKVTKDVAEQMAKKELAKDVGAGLAMFSSSYVQGVGDIFGETMDENGKGNLKASFLGAIPYAALDAITDLSVLKKAIGGTEGTNIIKRFKDAVIMGGVKEGSQEAAQESDLIIAGMASGKRYTDEEIISRLGNSFAAASLGGIAGGVPGIRKSKLTEEEKISQILDTLKNTDGGKQNQSVKRVGALLENIEKTSITVQDISDINEQDTRVLAFTLDLLKKSNPENKNIDASLEVLKEAEIQTERPQLEVAGKKLSTKKAKPTIQEIIAEKPVAKKEVQEAPKPTVKPEVQQKTVEKPVVESPPLQEGGKMTAQQAKASGQSFDEWVKGQGADNFVKDIQARFGKEAQFFNPNKLELYETTIDRKLVEELKSKIMAGDDSVFLHKDWKGKTPAIRVEELGYGKYKVNDGNHRLLAAKELGLENVPVNILGFGDTEIPLRVSYKKGQNQIKTRSQLKAEWEGITPKVKQSEIIKKATEANTKRLKKEGWVAPVKPIETKEKPLKLKYPPKKELTKELTARKEAEEKQPGNVQTLTDKILADKKLVKTDFDKAGIHFPKKKILNLLKLSPEFKANPVLTMKNGLLRFEGKTNKFGIKPEAIGLTKEIIEGTQIEINEEELKMKDSGEIAVLASLSQKEIKRRVMSDKKIMEIVSKLSKELNPSIRKMLVVEIADSLMLAKGTEADATYWDGIISLSRKLSAKNVDVKVIHEIRHLALREFFGREGMVKINKWFLTLTEADKVKIFGDKTTYELYKKEYGENFNMMSEETAIWALDSEYSKKLEGESKEFFDKFKVIVRQVMDLIKKILRMEVNPKYNKNWNEVRTMFDKIFEKDTLLTPANMGKFTKFTERKSLISKGYDMDVGGKKMQKMGSISKKPLKNSSAKDKDLKNYPLNEISKEKLTKTQIKKILSPLNINTALNPLSKTIRASEALQQAWRQVYKEEAPRKVIDMLHRNDVDIVLSGIRRGFVAGKQAQRIQQQEDNVEKRIKEAEKNKKLRKEITQKYKDKSTPQDEKRTLAIEYIKTNLPKELHKDFLHTVKNTKTDATLKNTILRVDEKRKGYERRQIIKAINKVLTKLQYLPVSAQTDILAITNQIQLKHHTKALLDKIATNKLLYDSLSADLKKNTSFKVLEELKLLDRKPLAKLSTQKLMEINNKIQQLAIIGRYELKQHKEDKKKTVEQKLEEFNKDTIKNLGALKPEDVLNTHDVRALSLTEKGKLKLKNAIAALKLIDLKQIGTDRIIRILDKGIDDLSGVAARHIYNPIMDKIGVATDRIDNFEELTKMQISKTVSLYMEEQGINKVIADKENWRVNKKYFFKYVKLQQELSQDLAVYFHSKNEHSLKKLLQGKDGKGKYTMEKILEIQKQVESSKALMDMVAYMKKWFEFFHPELSKTFTKLHPTEQLGLVADWFFPNRTDYKVTGETANEDVDRMASVNFSSLKSRYTNSEQRLSLDAFTDFRNYGEATIYYVEMAETIEQVRQIINSDTFLDSAGEIAKDVINTWLKIVAKRGGRLRQPNWVEGIIDTLRTNIAPAILGFRPSTVVVQISAAANGIAFVGEEAYYNGIKMMTSKNWRKFMKENSWQMRHRMGGDVMWEDLSENQIIKMFQDFTTAGIRIADYGPAGATWMGGYQKKMKELKLDINGEFNKEAGAYADMAVRMSQATAHFATAPQILFNENRTWWRMLHTFETFMLSNWAQVSKDVPAAWRKDKKAGARKAAWLLVQFSSETATRMAVASLVAGMIGDDDDKDESFVKNLLANMVQTIPFANKIFSFYNYQTDPVVVTRFIMDFFYNSVMMIKGAKSETRRRNMIKALAGVLQARTGLPPDFIVKTLIKIMENN